jgi:4,5-epoxidase
MPSVLIVGAGPTGLALACGLLSHGVGVRLVDGADGPAVTSRALGLQPRGVEVLDRLGALADLPDRSLHIAGTVLHGADGREKLRLTVPPGEVLGGRSALIISQAEIESRLRDRVAGLGGVIEWGRGLAEARQDTGGVHASFTDGSAAYVRWLVGCDGAGSRVRICAEIRLVGQTGAERFLLADARLDLPLERGFASMWVDPNGSLAAVPLPGDGWWRLMAPNPPGQPDDLPREKIAELLAQAVGERAGLPDPGIREVAWASTFRIHRRLASTYRHERILLAGDAAHIHSPMGGQGLNTGIGDAENLAWKLALVINGQAAPALLDSYQAERRPIAKAVVSSVGAVDRLLVSRNPLLRLARERVLYPIAGRPAVQLRIWRKASQLDISYRHGPLAQRPGRLVHGRRGGDRIHDLRCHRTDSTPTRLHAELRGRWAVLAGTPGRATEASETARVRLDDRIVPLYVPGRSGDHVMLVRPDAHLAWQGPYDPAAIDRWLDSALRHGTTRR